MGRNDLGYEPAHRRIAATPDQIASVAGTKKLIVRLIGFRPMVLGEGKMDRQERERPSVVIGPLGEALTLETLPPADRSLYWVARRKAQVVAAINGGLLTIEEACERYGLTTEELAAWSKAAARSGVGGLRVTHGDRYRKRWSDEERDAERLRRITHREKPAP